MISCTPNDLLNEARCFRCIPAGMQREVQIYLLCQWANTSGACQHDTVDNWALRVVANGGAAPSQVTLTALCEFMVGMDAAGLTPKMEAVNCLVPDNIIAAKTPLIVGTGNDPWADVGPAFVAADLNVNGLISSGANALDTGVVPNASILTDTSAALTVYNMTAQNEDASDIGCFDGVNAVRIIISNLGGFAALNCWDFAGGAFVALNPLWSGFMSGNRIAANSVDIYLANSFTPFASLIHGVTTGGARPTNSIYFYAWNFGGIQNPNTRRFSFAAIHQGLTFAECQAFYNLIQTLRTSLGGGFV